MTYDPARHHRRSIRLPGYDYSSPNTYFVTLVTRDRRCLFGDISGGQILINRLGAIVAQERDRSAEIRREIELHAFVVMPNHVHGIVIFQGIVGAHGRALPPIPTPQRPPRSLGSFIAGFKAGATRRINEIRRMPRVPVWQRNYYDRVVRDDKELARIRQYIIDNPARWAEDPENPANAGAYRNWLAP